MNQEDIIRMAHESGMYRILDQHASEYGGGMFEDTPYPELDRFAELRRLYEENKELLAVLKRLVAYLAVDADTERMVRAAIAKAEGV